MVRNLARLAGGAACAALLGVSTLGAQSYQVADLGTLGGTKSMANGISWNGLVAGDAKNSSSVKHAVLWDATGIMDLGAPRGFLVSTAIAVNDDGRVAAIAEGNPQAYRAYIWENGRWTDVGTLPGHTDSLAAAIDGSGRIAGTSLTLGAGNDRAFLWEAGSLTDLGTLGAATQAKGINEDGEVTGWSLANLPGGGTGTRAFLWKDGLMSDLGVLPGEEHSRGLDINDLGVVAGSSWHVLVSQQVSDHQATLWRDAGSEVVSLGDTPGPEICISGHPFYTDNVALALNNCGQVVGHAQCVVSGGPLAAFLWQDGMMHNLNDLIPAGSGWDLLSAMDVNDAGQIVGVGLAPNGELHGYRLDPDEPVACGLLALEILPDRMSWMAVPGAVAYDIVRGDLGTLRGTSGDFAQATSACLADDHPSTTFDYSADPAVPGEGFWILIRPVGSSAAGSYDDGPALIASRDPGIEASSSACP